MKTFGQLLNWKLKRGSHRFPGPAGGTCINEAALIAAGFEYKPVFEVGHMPECFSRPICQLALLLNDLADDRGRQRLIPYVARLACADTPEIEAERADYIRIRIGRHCSECAGYRSYDEAALIRYDLLSLNKGLEILEGALAIGRQADPLRPDEVLTRMDKVRKGRSIPVPALALHSVSPFSSKLANWLT